MLSPRSSAGFTLVELLLYIALAGILLTAFTAFSTLVIRSRIKHQSVSEVEEQSTQLMYFITQAIRNSEEVATPAPGANSNTLSITVTSSAHNPTVFDLAAGAVRITEGTNTPIILTSPLITISDLQFSNLPLGVTSGTVRIRFTARRVNPNNVNEYDFTKVFTGAAGIRRK